MSKTTDRLANFQIVSELLNTYLDHSHRERELMMKYTSGERKTIKGADGYQYYQDTGERVLPNVVKTDTVKAPSTKQAIDRDGNLVFATDQQISEGGYTPYVAGQSKTDTKMIGGVPHTSKDGVWTPDKVEGVANNRSKINDLMASYTQKEQTYFDDISKHIGEDENISKEDVINYGNRIKERVDKKRGDIKEAEEIKTKTMNQTDAKIINSQLMLKNKGKPGDYQNYIQWGDDPDQKMTTGTIRGKSAWEPRMAKNLLNRVNKFQERTGGQYIMAGELGELMNDFTLDEMTDFKNDGSTGKSLTELNGQKVVWKGNDQNYFRTNDGQLYLYDDVYTNKYYKVKSGYNEQKIDSWAHKKIKLFNLAPDMIEGVD